MRWLGLTVDPEPGGSTYDVLNTPGPVAFPAPTMWVPVSTAQVELGEARTDRNGLVYGRRANAAPAPLSSRPVLTFASLAFPKLVRALVSRALGGAPASTGAPPAAVTSKVEPIQEDPLPAVFGKLVREGQTDRLAGAVVGSFELNLTAEEEGALTFNMPALYHEVGATAAPETPNYAGMTDGAYMLRDVEVFEGPGAGVKIDCVSGVGINFDNSLSDEFTELFCAGENVREFTVAGKRHRVWYPGRHRIGPQAVTGRLDFGDVRPTMDERRLIAATDKLVVEMSADPLGTTPIVDEMARFTISQFQISGGGAEELAREGAIASSYEWTGYIDPATNTDFALEVVGAAALPAYAAAL